VCALATLLLATTLTLAAAAAAAAGAAPSLRYATVKRACALPAPGRASCFALELVPAAADQPAALAYQPAAGATAKGPTGGLTPADLASAYSFSPSAGGSGQTVAVVDAFNDPDIESDLASFDQHYGLAACTTADGCFEKVSQTGSTKSLPPAAENGWSVETSLDVETVHSACPSCKVLLVEANSEELSDLAAATDEAVALGATVVSNSYGASEGEDAAYESSYEHPGVVVLASAGDSGFLEWDDVGEGLTAPEQPDAPASFPSVVAVGGTTLKLSAKGARRSETVWNNAGKPNRRGRFSGFKQFAAAGGGCSTLFGAPSWQLDAAGWSATGCGSHRLDNDVAAVADPYTGFDIYDSDKTNGEEGRGWLTIGGTSLSSPLIAAMYALAGGAHGVADPAETLYGHLGQASALYDVTKGGNGYCDAESEQRCGEPAANEELGEVDCLGTTACDAADGFDGPTGVGTPVGLGAFEPKT